MKILLINKWVAGATKGDFYYPGTWRDTFELACTFGSLGHDITILTPKVKEVHLDRFEKEFGSHLRRCGVTIEFAKTYVQFNKGFGAFRLRMFLDEIKLIRKFKPQIIQYMQFGPSLVYPFAKGTPIVFYSCDQFNSYPKEEEDVENTIKSWSDKNHFFLIISNLIFLVLLKLFGSSGLEDALGKKSIFIIKHPRGFHHLKNKFKKYSNKIYFVAKAVTPPKNEFDFKSSKFTLLFLGTISYRKGVFDLLKALEGLNLKNLNIVIAGSGPKTLVSKVKSSIKRSGLKVNVFGPVSFDQRWTLYKKSDIFCLPSYQDSYPSVILEAMHIGLPVITTNQIDTPVKKDVSGILVDAGDVKSLGDAIARLYGDTNLRKKLSANAKKSLAYLTWDLQAKKLLSIYNELLFSPHER